MSTHVSAVRVDDGESHDEYMKIVQGLLGHTKCVIFPKPVVNDAESI